MGKIKNNRGQQEMVGFVLIVVIVMVALMVFLVISLRTDKEIPDSVEVENMLDVLMKKTTGCAIVFEPQYDSYEDLIKSCQENKRCSNLDKMACDYLKENLRNEMEIVMGTESVINSYNIEANYVFDEELENIFSLGSGNCSGSLSGAQRIISSGGGKILVRLILCKD